jgi:RHS repeat-associated protein
MRGHPVVYDRAYAPYGEQYDGSSNSDLDFTGQSQDTLSGMYDFLYREYNPVQGRWISPDPAGLGAVDPSNPQSWNRYAYVLNNPLSFADPLGLFCVWDNGSYDSNDDPGSGNKGACEDQAGGTWFNGSPSDWDPHAGDWSGSASGEFASWAHGINPNGVGDDWQRDGMSTSVDGGCSPGCHPYEQPDFRWKSMSGVASAW